MTTDGLIHLDIYAEHGMVIMECATDTENAAFPFDPQVTRAIAIKLVMMADEAEGVGAS